jgi:4'-phosphopantetheinyl transferase
LHNLPKPRAPDVVIYLYKDSVPPPRNIRLAECARRYSQWRELPPGDFTLATAAGGKPYFPLNPHVHFSISHSGEYWAVAFSGYALGLDIQSHVERDYLAVAKRWYHIREYAAVEQYGLECFYDIWCAKESLIKCSGEGFSASFSLLCVVKDGAIAPACSGLQLKSLQMIAGYSACLCAKKLGRIYAPLPGCLKDNDDGRDNDEG